MALRELLIKVGVEVDKGTERETMSSIKRIKDGLFDIKTAIAGIAIGAGIKKVGEGMFALAKESSSVEENLQKLSAILGEDLQKDALKFSETTAKAFGRSKFDVARLIGEFSSLTKPMLGSAEAALKLSKSAAQAALDMETFEDIPLELALEKIRAGLVGSSEPLLAVGIDTRVAAIEQYALAQGITKTTKEMSQAEIVSLRYSKILSDMLVKKAIGSSIRESDSFAGRLRSLNAAVGDVRKEAGKKLQPAFKALFSTIEKFVRGNGDVFVSLMQRLSGAMQSAVVSADKFLGFLKEIDKRAKKENRTFFEVAYDEIIKSIDNFFVEMFKSISKWSVEISKSLGDVFAEAGATILTSFLNDVNALKDVFFNFAEFIMNWIDDITTSISEGFSSAFSSIGDSIMGVFGSIGNFFSLIGKAFGLNLDTETQNIVQHEFDMIQAMNNAKPNASVPTSSVVNSSSNPSFNNSPQTTVNISVDAAGSADPKSIASMVAREVRAENERQYRQTLQAFAVTK